MSSEDLSKYHNQVGQVAKDAALFKQVFVKPILDSSASGELKFLPPDARKEPIKKAIQGTFLEGLGEDAVTVAVMAANAVASHNAVFDSLPSEEIRASAINTMRNMVASSDLDEGNRIKMVMDSATGNMSNQDGITRRNHQIALITPVNLMQATNDFVTYVPPHHDRSEIFIISRHAGKTFGEMKQGEVIDETFNKQYATLDQMYPIGVGDGSKTEFEFDIKDLSINKQAMPIKKGYVRVYHDLDLVAEDHQADGLVSGSFELNGNMITVSSSQINYTEGKGAIRFSNPIADGVTVNIGLDIDIEKAPQLIPTVEHEVKSCVVKPHEGAIHVTESIQAVFAAKREFGLELRGMYLTGARNAFAAEKDRKRLRTMWKFAKWQEEFPRLSRTGISDKEYRDVAVKEFLRGVSNKMLHSNKKSGGKGIFGGIELVSYLMSVTGFVIRPNYQPIPQPHYVGRLGEFAIYCDPAADPWDGLMIGKGQNYGDSGFIAADAISAIQYNHPVLAPSHGVGKGLVHSDTLYELAYRDIHPYKGREYFARFTFTAKIGG